MTVSLHPRTDLPFVPDLADEAGTTTLRILETLHSKAPVGFAFLDRSLRLVRLNQAMADIFGLDGDAIGRPLCEVLPRAWRRIEPMMRQVAERGEPVVDVEITWRWSDPHDPRQLLASFYPVASDHVTIGIGAVVVDVTERRQSEEEARFQSEMLSVAGQAVVAIDLDRVIIHWNRAAEEMYGWTAAEAIGRKSYELLPRKEAASTAQVIIDAMREGRTLSHDYEFVRRDGTTVSTYVTHKPMFDPDGNLEAVIAVAIDVSERRAGELERLAVQRELEQSRRRLSEAQRTAHLGSFEFDVTAGDLRWSDEFFRILRLDQRILPSAPVFMSMVHPDDLAEMQSAWKAAIEIGRPFDLEFRVVAADSVERFVHMRAVAETDTYGEIVRLAGTMTDITERVEADRVRGAAEMRFEIGFEQSAIGAVITDLHGIPTRVNGALCSILGRPAEQLLGRRWTEYTPTGEVWMGGAVQAREVLGNDTFHDERRYVRPDGSIVWTSCHVTLVRDVAGLPQYYFVQLQDITERKLMEIELAHQAVHDTLTGLPNRALLTDRLNHGLAGAKRRNSQLGVMFLDVDQFKLVNDAVGHESGDHLLREIARRILAAVRPGDTVARFGGDEFVVVCDDVTQVEAEQIAARVLDFVRRPTLIGETEIHTSVSLGLAFSDDASTAASLLRDSDAAMYLAKERGRSRVEVFGESLRAKAVQRWVTSAELHRALERGELAVHYQPVIDIANGSLVSAEALVRWNHPERGLVGPVEFIPFAEENGLVVPIGEWVLEEACRQLREWQQMRRGHPDDPRMSIAVNLSVRQMLAPDIATVISDVLHRTGIQPEDLCLELTESVFMEDADYFSRVLAEIKAIGVDLAIDDFGTGYSSLSYLKQFPVDTVKIDRAFVDGLGTDPHDTALVAAIVAMAGALDLSIIAEGAETNDQLVELGKLGVRRVQGYVLARPMPADALTRLIAARTRWAVR
ncbi:MAG: hypothetical protein JWM34_582 [Ilumatobacteraceae bacterium]|nr:hypothetical protein [Ilumatobacteraceae bacterium]